MENQKDSIIARLKQAKNVLVTVNNNPSVDQLAAALGATLALNKAGMRANAVFSGKAPSIIDFLQPDATFEKTTDSLRDFIISLDKDKADKLRYKVEDNHVKIFITPYKNALTQEDLVFEQGEFNVDVVLALGVKEKQDLDSAITAQGRILHDATIIDINTNPETSLGTLIWTNGKASSLCEMVLNLVTSLKKDVLDEQISTALLTGMVAETERFSNNKTTPEVMQASGQLMAAGANQQLIASKLQAPEPEPEPETAELPEPEKQSEEQEESQQESQDDTAAKEHDKKTLEEIEGTVNSPHLDEAEEKQEDKQEEQPEEPVKKDNDGTLSISHADENAEDKDKAEEDAAQAQDTEEKKAEIHIDENGRFFPDGAPMPSAAPETPTTPPPSQASTRPMATAPPSRGSQLTANSQQEQTPPSIDMLGGKTDQKPLLNRDDSAPAQGAEAPSDTLENLEKAVDSPHLAQAQDTSHTAPPMPPVEPQPQEQQPTNEPEVDPNLPPAVPPPMMPPVNPPSDNSTGSL